MSIQTSNNNKRIAKNTLLLYFRMLLMMLIYLYTNRVVLDKLGVTDYGIYNVVGGIIAMLGFLNGCMTNAVQRFLSYEMGRNGDVNKVFNVSLMIHCIIALIVFLVMEIGGVWYLNTYMNIPYERLEAANWVLQCTLLTTMFTIIQVPYNAIIISKEEMGIYAYVSIFEVILKLLLVFLLGVITFDRLKLYGILMTCAAIIVLMVYRVYCMKKYPEAKFRLVKDKKQYKELLSFSGWNMLSEMAWSLTGPGVNVILNGFFGPTVNAARGIGEIVNGAVSRFVGNFQTAVNPQIIKLYAAHQIREMQDLVFNSTRYSYYLLLILSLPLILVMEFILGIWLKQVPEYAVQFCQLILVCSLVSVNSNLLPKIVWATGHIRNYQIIVSVILMLNFPLSYLVLRMGASPLATVWVAIIIQVVLIFVRLYLACRKVNIKINDYLKNVFWVDLRVTLLAVIIPVSLNMCLTTSLWNVVLVCLVSCISVLGAVYSIGLSKKEKKKLSSFLLNFKAKYL